MHMDFIEQLFRIIRELFRIMMDKDARTFLEMEWDSRWHPDYRVFSQEAFKRAEGVRRGDLISVSNPSDWRFLNDLIYLKYNGIASVGLSMLKRDNYKILIGDEGFMEALNAFANAPRVDTYSDFYRKWERISRANEFNFTKARANRVAAAFSTDVSATVDEAKFGKVYRWLAGQGVLDDRFHGFHDNWFARNEHVMKVLRREFKKELASGETDIYWLNMFIQFIWYAEFDDSTPIKERVARIREGRK